MLEVKIYVTVMVEISMHNLCSTNTITQQIVHGVLVFRMMKKGLECLGRMEDVHNLTST